MYGRLICHERALALLQYHLYTNSNKGHSREYGRMEKKANVRSASTSSVHANPVYTSAPSCLFSDMPGIPATVRQLSWEVDRAIYGMLQSELKLLQDLILVCHCEFGG